MKQITLAIVLLFGVFTGLFAQKTTNQPTNPTIRVQEKIYRLALENNDLEVATNAVYQLLAIQPEKTSWEDTLCLLYHGRGYYLQSGSLAKKILKRNPEALAFREVLAQAYENTGNYLDALRQYDALLKADVINSVYLYKMVLMQYMLKYYNDCEKTVLKIIEDPASNNMTITTQIDPEVSEMKEVPLKAAILNILGVVYMDMNQSEKAEEAFNKALVLQPDYIMVKQNLLKLKAPSKSTP
ncbi:MAG: tetratricopeptide repeat protein [Bacteroidia bacterium]